MQMKRAPASCAPGTPKLPSLCGDQLRAESGHFKFTHIFLKKKME